MIRAFVPANGRVVETPLASVNAARSLVWVDVENPSMHDLHEVHEKFTIPLSDLKHCLDVHEVPRVRVHGNYILIILGTVCDGEGVKACAPLGLVVSKRYVLTIHAGNVKVMGVNGVKDAELAEAFVAGVDALVYRLCFLMVREFAREVNLMGDEMDRIEDAVLQAYREGVLQHISEFKNRLLYYRKALFGNRNVMGTIVKEKSVIANNLAFEDITVELSQLLDLVELYRERLTMSMDMFLTSASNRVNEAMKAFTVIGSLLIIPMLLTGLYGMNVVLPLQAHPYAFWIVVGMMVLAVMVMLVGYKWRRWI